MAGATSLVQLILKKWGDDAVGAAKELEEMVGYPESVANRIATGELPMDEASRVARREAQSTPTNLFHGSTHDIKEFSGSGGSLNDWGQGTYLTDSAYDASSNYAGTHGADFQGKARRIAKEMASYTDEPPANFMPKAIKKFKGDSEGVVYPLRALDGGLLKYDGELGGDAWEEIGGIMGKYDIEGDIIPSEHEPQFVGRIIEENADRMTPEEIATLEKYAPQGHSGVVDTTTPQRYSGMGAGNHTVIFPGNENKIRSVNAAFDPQYTGPNIMGNADPRLLAGTAAGTAGLLAAPMLADKDKPLPVPTWGDIGESVMNVLGMPMTGLQGLARGGYGLLTGEDFTEAAAQAGNTMDVGWRDGVLDVSQMNPDKGADQAEAYVTENTGDESLGWMAKMGLLFGGL